MWNSPGSKKLPDFTQALRNHSRLIPHLAIRLKQIRNHHWELRRNEKSRSLRRETGIGVFTAPPILVPDKEKGIKHMIENPEKGMEYITIRGETER